MRRYHHKQSTMRVEYRAIAHPHAAERIRTAYDIIMHATPRPIDAAIKLVHRERRPAAAQANRAARAGSRSVPVDAPPRGRRGAEQPRDGQDKAHGDRGVWDAVGRGEARQVRGEEREHGGRSRAVRLSHEQHQGDHEQPRGERHGTEILERGEQTPIGRGDGCRTRSVPLAFSKYATGVRRLALASQSANHNQDPCAIVCICS